VEEFSGGTMAGRAKQGLDYAAWSTDIFDNDTKIDKLLESQGWYGFNIYFYLCMRAMGSNGYYYKWCYDDCASTARKMGGAIRAGTVKEAVDYCFQIGLFNRELFEEWGVLTSRGIQRSYWLVLKTRRSRSVYKELWLLKKEECEGLAFVSINGDMSGTNDHLQGTNGNMQATNAAKVKESKGKESKDRECMQRIEEFMSAYPKDCNRYLTEHEYVSLLLTGKVAEDELVQCAKNYAETCRILETQERYIKNAENFLKEFVFEKYLPGRYRKPAQPKGKNSFHDFPQNDYDFEQLEKEILSN